MPLPLEWVKKIIDDDKKVYYFDYRLEKQHNYSALEAAQKNIEYIVNHFPKPYNLYLSGGIDSQAMLYAWHLSGQEYEAYSAKYNYDLNSNDLKALQSFAKIYNIKINYFDFDLINFLKEEHDFYANTYLTGSPQFTAFMKMASLKEDGTVIMSGNFLQTTNSEKNFSKNYLNYPCKNGIGLYHFARKTGKNFIPFFWLEQPEVAYAFTENEYVKQFYDLYGNISTMGTNVDPELSKLSPYVLKVALYQSHGFPVLRQPTKLNGFEEIKKFYDQYYEVPTEYDLFQKINKNYSNRVFDVLYRNKYEAKLKKVTYGVNVGLK